MSESRKKVIEHVLDDETLRFVEEHLCLMPLGPREEGFAVLEDTNITPAGAKALADATSACWEAILAHDLRNFGASVRASFEAQIAMFPNMVTPGVRDLIATHSNRALGWKLSGAGGGYVIFVTEQPLPDSMRVVVRRRLE